MVDDRERRRVLCIFETHWDRAQLAACRHAWQDRIDVVYPPPDDVECPSELDPLAFVDAAVGGAFGRVDGVMSSSDYPGATLAAAIATRLGLPGARPERVIRMVNAAKADEGPERAHREVLLGEIGRASCRERVFVGV